MPEPLSGIRVVEMAIVRIPTPLRSLTGGKAEVEVGGGSVREVLANLEAQHPGFSTKVQDAEGQVLRFVNVFVNADDIRDKDGIDTPAAESDTITIVPAIAGGSR